MPILISGLNQQTAATVQIIRQAMSGSRSTTRRSTKRRRTTTKSRRKPAKRRATRGSRKPARLVKGSPAARAYMKKIRRKRK